MPADGHYYIYLVPDGSPPPEAEEFVPVSWEWVGAQLQSFLSEAHGRYPAQTTAQLTEFISTIESELTMTEYRENQREKASLYFEYYDEIGDAREAFENQWDEFAGNWGTRLAPTIDGATITELPGLSDSHVAIEVEQSHRDRSRWMFRQGDSDWAGVVKDGWWRAKGDLSPIYGSMDGKQDVRISLYHRLEQNRDRAIRDRTLEFQLWHGTGNGDEFMYSYRDTLAEKIDDERDAIPPNVELTGKRGNPLIATYDIPVGEHDDFFRAYLAALREGFLDLAVERPRVIELIDQSFEECLDVFS